MSKNNNKKDKELTDEEFKDSLDETIFNIFSKKIGKETLDKNNIKVGSSVDDWIKVIEKEKSKNNK